MFFGDNEGLITFNILMYSNLDCTKKNSTFLHYFFEIR